MTHRQLARIAAAATLTAALAACGSDKKSTATATTTGAGAPAASATNAVQVEGFAFKPSSITVKAGTTVTWSFKDSTTHTVESKSASDAFKSGDKKGGDTFTHTFSSAGSYDYFCGIHNSMTGTVIVTA